MRLAQIALALTAIFLLTACADSDEDIPTPSPTPTPANAVVFCPRIGDGSTPLTTTPEPSCDPGDSEPQIEVADGVFASKGIAPPLPTGATPLSNYFEFRGVDGIAGLTLSVPMRIDTGDQSVDTIVPPGMNAVWYTHGENGWTPLIDAIVENDLASGAFSPLPPNVIVLAEAP